jgi:hypothetical protein
MDLRESQIAAQMLAKVEAANATEVQKRAFSEVCARTIRRCLKEQGLLWAMQHVEWTVDDWKRVIFSDESNFMLFKSGCHQYCYIKPGQVRLGDEHHESVYEDEEKP